MIHQLKSQQKKIKGITLLEVILSLAIIALILVMATRYYGLAHLEEQVNDTTSMIQSIRAAGQHWLLSHDDYRDINIPNLIQRDLIPKNFTTNPWGGGIQVGPGPGNNTLRIVIQNIPINACINLERRFARTQPTPGSCVPGPGNLSNYIGVFK